MPIRDTIQFAISRTKRFQRQVFVVFFSVMCLLVTFLVSPTVSDAAPMYTKLETIRQKADTIVIGNVVSTATSIVVDVDTVVRGIATKGPMSVKNSPDGSMFLNTGDRVVVFVDKQGSFRWVGELIAGPTLEDGVFLIRGFFDYNAHHVSPGLMSLEQLKGYLGTGVLQQTFNVRIAFPDGKGGLAPSKRQFTVDYDAVARKTKITGLSATCLDGEPWLHSLDSGRFELSMRNTCPRSQIETKRRGIVRLVTARALDLRGKVTGLDSKSQTIAVEVAPTRPFLYENQFDKYLTNGDFVDVEQVVEVVEASGKKWKWHVDRRLVDPRRRSHKAGSTSISAKGNRYGFGKTSIWITPGANGNSFSLLQLLDSASLKGCRIGAKNKTKRPCTLKKAAPLWVKAP